MMEAILRVLCPMCDGERRVIEPRAKEHTTGPMSIVWRNVQCSVCDGAGHVDVQVPLQIPDDDVRTSTAVYVVSTREGAA